MPGPCLVSLMKRLLLCLLLVSSIPLTGFAQNRIGTGKARELYELHCATCHGVNMEGGMSSSLIDDQWQYGSSDEALNQAIAKGFPDNGMEAYEGVLSPEEIRSLVIFIHEQNEIADKDALLSRLEPREGVFSSEVHDFRLEKVAEGDGILWGIDFLPDATMLVTQRDGKLWHIREGEDPVEVTGLPTIWVQGQGGLMDVAVHPDYETNGWIYLGYTEHIGVMDGNAECGMTTIVRGKLSRNGEWIAQERIFRAPPEFHWRTRGHVGTRIVFQDGYLFFGIGDRNRSQHAQDLSYPNASIHRLWDDGRIPEDNPFVPVPGAFPSVWSYGHRNPQGLAFHPETGDLWETEHGPRGGDEVNRIERGKNYGWPVITYGMNYNGTPITEKTEQEGMEQPELYWTPSIAVCGIEFYRDDSFSRWKNNLFVAGLASQELHRLVIEGGQVIHSEIVMKNQGRIRDVSTGPDGNLYVLLNSGSPRIGAVYRLVPAGPVVAGRE
jgi:glucose/arabinose dehydrogenase